ncbi:MAG: SRPBCC domain-containing protein [Alphaproteobacteria bacterium]|nr:SRPBCC domain-containing protein [Alphaproteobacteria bacterium]
MTSRVIVALRVKANASRAFDVFTREIALWWQPNAMFQFTPRSPGRLAFEPPAPGGEGGRFTETLASGKVFEIGKISVWEPGVRLVFGWRHATFAPGQHTEVEVLFEPVGSETRVTIEHRGWDSVPAEHVAKHSFPETVFLRRHGEWWQAQLEALRALAQTVEA